MPVDREVWSCVEEEVSRLKKDKQSLQDQVLFCTINVLVSLSTDEWCHCNAWAWHIEILDACLSVCLFVCPFCLSVCLCVHFCVFVCPFCLSVYLLFVSVSVYHIYFGRMHVYGQHCESQLFMSSL